MGYLNPVLQYGMDRFCADCERTGIDGIILPDLPLEVFLEKSGPFTEKGSLKELFESRGLHAVFLVSPQTTAERIRQIDKNSGGFIYMVSSSSTTGKMNQSGNVQEAYFERMRDMGLQNPRMIGFGISDHLKFAHACRYANGAIIGSAFVEMLANSKDLDGDIRKFVREIRC
jgi:tryptophan synthase alpha chain